MCWVTYGESDQSVRSYLALFGEWFVVGPVHDTRVEWICRDILDASADRK